MRKFKRVSKHALILLSILVFSFVSLYVVPTNQAKAAIYSKVATTAAKKAAKEIVKDSAVEMAMDIIFHYQMEEFLKDDYDTPKQGYTPVCLDKKSNTCNKPMQAKVPTTTQEKKQLGDKVEEILDRKTNMNGWKKFLDWFVPIFLVSGFITYISTLFDSDTENLLDEVAKEALTEEGFISPLPPKKPVIIGIDDNVIGLPQPEPVSIDNPLVLPDTITTPLVYEFDFSNRNASNKTINLQGVYNYFNSAVIIDVFTDKETFPINAILFENSEQKITYTNSWYEIQTRGKTYSGFPDSYHSTGNVNFPYNYNTKLKSLIITGEVINGRYRTNMMHINSVGANHIGTGGTWAEVHNLVNLTSLRIEHQTTLGYNLKIRLTVLPSIKEIRLTPYMPEITDYKDLKSVELLPYRKDDGKLPVLPPIAIPIETPEGIPVIPNPTSPGDWINPITKEPVPVPNEDDLIVRDPIETPEGDGYQLPDGTVLPKPEPEPEPTPTPNKPDLDQLGNNVPKELILALLDLLRSCLYFMVRLVTFITGIPFITTMPIPYESLVWFFNVELLGIKVVEVMRLLAITGLSFGIYKLVKKVF